MARDERHADAVRIWRRLRNRSLATTNLIIAEVHALLVRRAGAARATPFLEGFLDRREPSVTWVDEALTRAAVANWIRPYGDKSWSLADAVSFEVMKSSGMSEVFGFDAHFEQAGFTLLRAR